MNNEPMKLIQAFLQGMKDANLGNNDQYMTGYFRAVDAVKEYVDHFVEHNKAQEQLARS